MDDSDESEGDDCIDNDGSSDGGVRACEICDATRSTRWHERKVEKYAVDAQGRKTNDVIGTLITLDVRRPSRGDFEKNAEENAARLSCARCNEESGCEEEVERCRDKETDELLRRHEWRYLVLKMLPSGLREVHFEFTQEREKVKKEETTTTTTRPSCSRIGRAFE